VGQFFIRVWFPCLIHYQQYPSQLLKHARKGNINALIDLIRLDKGIVRDPKIAEIIFHYGNSGKRGIAKKIARAMQQWPKALNPTSLKYRLGLLVKASSNALQTPVKNPDLLRMFNEVEAIKTGGESIVDLDFPDDPESFSRSVRMKDGSWDQVLPPSDPEKS
jgi:hypothetical protein